MASHHRKGRLVSGLGLALLGLASSPTREVRAEELASGEVARSGDLPAPTPITLSEVVRAAMRGNPTLVARAIDVRIADARIQEALGVDDVTVDATTSWVSSHVPGAPGVVGTPTDRFRVASGATVPIPTGGEFGARLGGEVTLLSDVGAGRTSAQVFTPSLLLSFSQPLLRGAGAPVARAGGRRARASRDLAVLQREASLAGVLRDVTRAFAELAFASSELEIRVASVELAREQLRAVRANIEVGKLPPSAAAEVEVAIALREEERLVTWEGLRARSRELRQLMGLAIVPGDPPLFAEQPPEVEPLRRTADEVLAIMIERSPELHSLRAQRRVAAIEVEIADDQLLPALDLVIAAGPIGNSTEVGTALAQMATFEGFAVQAGLSFSQPVGAHAAEGRSRAAKETAEKVRLMEEEVTAALQAAALSAFDRAATAERRRQVLARATELARLDLAAERARFESGRASSFDVLRRQDELARAELRLARAGADRLSARAGLEALTAEIIGRHQLTIQ